MKPKLAKRQASASHSHVNPATRHQDSVVRIIAFDSTNRQDRSLTGIPDITATRWMCFGIAMLLSCVALALPALTILIRPSPDLDPIALIVSTLIAAMLLVPAFMFARAGLLAGAWITITPESVEYGSGNGIVEKQGTKIEWARIASGQMARYDVRLILKGPVREPRIAFGYKMPDGTQNEYSLPMSLRERGMQCLWFVNADALRIALLQNMAARSNLCFDPDIFVEAGIDPETWHLMPKPRKIEWAIAIASMAAVLIFGSFISATTSVVLVVGGVFAILGLGLLATFSFRKRAYPGFDHVICFCENR
ncbi:hypothetical protein F9K97_14130 [Brucella anthropi]|nr:hypothetical protein [Brucella anthropi]QOD66835.1 hypothetical protein HGK82_15655 [Ochrobactrum sp. MT180101]KAB2767925.1 hypothetical protein F9K84_15065 [Brucella anthropi]KAB2770075.1 hypothetical protein F9L04_09950 [Brucella anthropi]KAB2785236.1 hypothetical protein F9K97_14130 [Brucella anthropi]KAB2790302.1 hypothetical protein F9K96_14895 [Brucella anthropi]